MDDDELDNERIKQIWSGIYSLTVDDIIRAVSSSTKSGRLPECTICGLEKWMVMPSPDGKGYTGTEHPALFSVPAKAQGTTNFSDEEGGVRTFFQLLCLNCGNVNWLDSYIICRRMELASEMEQKEKEDA